MSAARSHGGGDNGHSASIQIDLPVQFVAPSAIGAPFPLPAHHPNYNDDDEDSDENGPLLGASTATRKGPGPHHHQLVEQDDDETGQRRRSKEPAPFLYRLHDWLADRGTSKLLLIFFFFFVRQQKKNATTLITTTSHHARIGFARCSFVELDQNRWGKFLKWIFILLAVLLFIQLLGLCRLHH